MAEEEEKSIHEVITIAVGDAVSQAMKPVYYTIGGIMLTVLVIFVSIAWSVNDRVTQNTVDIDRKINSEESYKNFITKNQYFYLQKEEHKADIQAINNPLQCHDIYDDHNESTSESLEIRYRSGKLETN